MSIQKMIKAIKNNIEMNHPILLPYLLMIQRRSIKPVCDWPLEKAIAGDMKSYKRHMGYTFDINNPILFTEKLQWYKFFYHRDDFSQITDKFLFKQYISQQLGEGYTIPVYNSWTRVDDLEKDWHSLPEEFVLKANLQSDGRNIKIIHKKSDIIFSKIKNTLKAWLDKRNTLANSWDYNFYRGTPRILAEKYMENLADQLFDYKFFCFNGEPYCMYVAQEHFDKGNYPISFYDLHWNRLDVRYGGHLVGDAPRPAHFDEMIEISKRLSKGFPFVRVDFFDTDEKLYVAELTFAPGGGVTPYHPRSFNEKLGELFVLPEKNSKSV